MTTVHNYKVWCNVENMPYETWGETEPTVCPNNSAHEIDPTKTTIIQTVEETFATNKQNKLVIQPTVRPFGTKVHFSGADDDNTDIDIAGHGIEIKVIHKIGDDITSLLYADFNTIDNLTYLQEGYLQWVGAYLDTVSVEVVPRTVQFTMGESSEYLWDGVNPVIVPAILNGGVGNVNIINDLTQPDGGLVFIHPPGDKDAVKSLCFWNATWNTSTKLFENISPAPNGDGDFNIFVVETILTRFMNQFQLLYNDSVHIDTDDADPIGQGMRLKVTTKTNVVDAEDHDWTACYNMKLHRAHSRSKDGT